MNIATAQAPPAKEHHRACLRPCFSKFANIALPTPLNKQLCRIVGKTPGRGGVLNREIWQYAL
jgi:hypothetical protein